MHAEEFVTVDGIEVHYAAWGNVGDPAVLCVHGLSRVGRDFDPVGRALADGYRVLCPDLPGRGLSEWAPDRYAPRALLELLVEFYDALDLSETRYVGTSLGGVLGMTLAAGPLADRIDRLVVNDVGPAPAADPDAEEGVERIVEYLTNPPTFDRFTEMEAYFRDVYATFSEQSDTEWRRLTKTSARRTDDGAFTPNYDPRVVEPVLRAEPPDDPWGTWTSIDAPTLVLRGRESDVLAESTFEEMLERRPETESLVVDCGHAPALNDDRQIGAIRSLFEE